MVSCIRLIFPPQLIFGSGRGCVRVSYMTKTRAKCSHGLVEERFLGTKTVYLPEFAYLEGRSTVIVIVDPARSKKANHTFSIPNRPLISNLKQVFTIVYSIYGLLALT